MTTRTDPSRAGGVAEQLRGFLDYHRETLRIKTDGLTTEQLDTPLAPSDMTLGGMLKHLAYVEHWWLREVHLGLEPLQPWAGVDWDADDD